MRLNALVLLFCGYTQREVYILKFQVHLVQGRLRERDKRMLGLSLADANNNKASASKHRATSSPSSNDYSCSLKTMRQMSSNQLGKLNINKGYHELYPSIIYVYIYIHVYMYIAKYREAHAPAL